MSDFIQILSDGFDVIIYFLLSIEENLRGLLTALGTIYTGLSTASVMFPSFLGGLLITCFSVLMLLRVMGR